jgi:PAS domain S-box-containing protein
MMPPETEIRTVNQLTIRLCTKIAQVSSVFTIVIGFSVLVGWIFDFRPLMTVLPGFVAMKPNTAVGLCFAGLSLLLFTLPVSGGRRLAKKHAAALAGAVTIIGAITLTEYITGGDFRIDQFIFRDYVRGSGGPYPPGRMAPITAFNFVCLGTALVLLHFPRRTRWTHLLTGFSALTSLLAIISYFYGVTSLFQSGSFTAVALHTAISFLALCAGIFCATANSGFMRVITASGTSGTLIRRYGLAAIVSPFLIGWLRVQGGRHDWYGMEFGAAIFAFTSAVIFAALAWIGANSLRIAERKQAVVQEKLRLAHIDLEKRVIARTSELAEAHAGLQAQMLERARVEHDNQQIMDNSLDVICAFNAQGRFLQVNRASAAVWGYSPEELIGRRFLDLVHADDREKTMAADASIMDGQAENGFENRYVRRDGSVVPMVWTAKWSAEHQTTFCVARDITARKQMESELFRAKEVAEAATQAKGDFLANMSHEIRTPMNGVLGMTSVLLDTPLTGEQKEIAETIQASAEALLAIVNDILDFSKIEAGKLELEVIDIDLAHVIRGTLRLLQEIAKAKGLELHSFIHAEVPTKLRGDGGRLRQVLVNLINNAIKFTPDGEVALHVSVDRQSEEAAFLRFRVTDTGIGISPKTQARLFQAFTQADGSISRCYGGTGLGLAICKQLVEKMGGSIGVESSLGAGSTFWFTAELLMQTSAVTEIAPQEARDNTQTERLTYSGNGRGPRVLVAEDNPVNRRIVLAQLKKVGYSCDSVANGLEVLEALDRVPYDLVLMDVQMPEMDGFEATQRIRELEKASGRRTRIVAMTAHAMAGDRERCLASGMDDYISKPLRRDDLLRALKEAGLLPHHDNNEKTFLHSRAELLSQCNGDDELMSELVSIFQQSPPQIVQSIGDAIEKRDAPALAGGAHKLLSSLGAFGARQAGSLALRLERHGQENDFRGTKERFTELERETDKIYAALAQAPRLAEPGGTKVAA